MWGIIARFIPSILDWVVGRVSPLINKIRDNMELKKRQDARIEQARVVREIRDKIFAIESAGAEAPPEMKERLRAEAHKLISM